MDTKEKSAINYLKSRIINRDIHLKSNVFKKEIVRNESSSLIGWKVHVLDNVQVMIIKKWNNPQDYHSIEAFDRRTNKTLFRLEISEALVVEDKVYNAELVFEVLNALEKLLDLEEKAVNKENLEAIERYKKEKDSYDKLLDMLYQKDTVRKESNVKN